MTMPTSPGPGFPANRTTTDMMSGTLAQQIQIWSLNVTQFSNWLVAQTEEVLTAPPFNYDAADVALLKSAVNDMVTLTQLLNGNDSGYQPARDLTVFMKQIAGVRMVS